MFSKLQERASQAASAASSFGQEAGRQMSALGKKAGADKINNPIIGNLADECNKAARILEQFISKGETSHGLDTVIPPKVMQNAVGFAIFTVVKAGFLWSGRAGSGIVVARLPDGSWSAPSAIATGGVGFGAQAGADITDIVLVMNSPEVVKAFARGGNVTVGGNLAVSAGPIGAGGEAALGSDLIASRKVDPMFSYTKSKGLFAGVSLEGTVLIELSKVNASFYGITVSAEQLLNGEAVQPPPEADVLYDVIRRGENQGTQ